VRFQTLSSTTSRWSEGHACRRARADLRRTLSARGGPALRGQTEDRWIRCQQDPERAPTLGRSRHEQELAYVVSGTSRRHGFDVTSERAGDHRHTGLTRRHNDHRWAADSATARHLRWHDQFSMPRIRLPIGSRLWCPRRVLQTFSSLSPMMWALPRLRDVRQSGALSRRLDGLDCALSGAVERNRACAEGYRERRQVGAI
jgi:hypothetical protein